jgi:hypothetical protein
VFIFLLGIPIYFLNPKVSFYEANNCRVNANIAFSGVL